MAPRTHTHHPDGKGPICRFPTKRECDEYWRAYQKQAKEDLAREEDERNRLKQEERVRRFDAFIRSQDERAYQLSLEKNIEETEDPTSGDAPSSRSHRNIRIPSRRSNLR